MVRTPLIGLAAIVVAFASTPSFANLVLNGDFETGNLTDWTNNPNSSDPWTVTDGSPVIGTFSASTGCVGAQCTDETNLPTASYLFQNLATVAGTDYTLTFEFTPDNGTPNELKVLWGGAVVDDLVNVPDTGFVDYIVANLVATSGSTQLEFLGRQDPGFDRLDSVDVEAAGTVVPEASTWAMMLIGFGGLSALTLAHRKRQRVPA